VGKRWIVGSALCCVRVYGEVTMSAGARVKESAKYKACSIPFPVSGIVSGREVAKPAFPVLSACLISQTFFVS
jgi:hypothetical protein